MSDSAPFSIAVVGGCQARGIRLWCNALLPGSIGADWHVNVSPIGAPEEIEKHLGRFDLIITQIADGSDTPTMELASLRDRYPSVVSLPLFVFPGFHPDITSCGVREPTSHFIRGPIEQLQSTLVIAAYQLGVERRRVPRLFNSLVYEEMGYLDAFESSRAAVTAIYAEHGYDIASSFDTWLEDGVFMYTNNHPSMRVLGTLARQALLKAGLSPQELADVAAPHDDLANSVRWPTHKFISARIGVPTEPYYGRIASAATGDGDRWIDLTAFVNASYDVMKNFAPASFINTEKIAHALARLRKILGAPGV
ncbi:MAG: WcbI family polysaccharide biosynthesis putative acetyltransferase [Micropepsaceae bacterium]